MQYKNTEIKLDSLITYFRENRINLAPVFQRGRAWKSVARQELMKNILRGRPIPAIFIYKKDAAEKYSFTILDGKQRLETILLFIADEHPKLKINNWKGYFGEHQYWTEGKFAAKYKEDKPKIRFSEMSDEDIRNLREYTIPMVEITLEDSTNLDEIIGLFVDINQRGAKVSRTQIVRAMKNRDPLLESVYHLVAEKWRVKQDNRTKVNKGVFTSVLENLSLVAGSPDEHAKADRMWSKLMEFAIFMRNNNVHGKGAAVLQKFIDTENNPKLEGKEIKKLRRVFKFLNEANKAGLKKTKLATDYSHFYILCTALLSSNMLPEPLSDDVQKELIRKLLEFGKLLEQVPQPKDVSKKAEYLRLSSKQTTDSRKRADRQKLFVEIMNSL